MDYDLNWSLNADGITPRGDTYHNITAEALGEEISFGRRFQLHFIKSADTLRRRKGYDD